MERLPIDVRLWALVSGVLFVGLLCIDAAGYFSEERNLALSFRAWRANGWSSWTHLESIASYALLYGAIAFVIGWALHGIAWICGLRFNREPSWDNLRDYQEPNEDGIDPHEPWDMNRLAALRQKGELLRRGRRK